MYYATYHGLHKWHEHMFTHFGWMILAKDQGYGIKIKAYMEGLRHLHEALLEGIEMTNDVDRKRDLEILLHNVLTLEKSAKRILKNAKDIKKSRRTMSSSSSRTSRRRRSKY